MILINHQVLWFIKFKRYNKGCDVDGLLLQLTDCCAEEMHFLLILFKSVAAGITQDYVECGPKTKPWPSKKKWLLYKSQAVLINQNIVLENIQMQHKLECLPAVFRIADSHNLRKLSAFEHSSSNVNNNKNNNSSNSNIDLWI